MKPAKKPLLTLEIETLRDLTPGEAMQINGGAPQMTPPIHVSVQPTPPVPAPGPQPTPPVHVSVHHRHHHRHHHHR